MSRHTPTTDEVRSAAATLNMCPYSEFDRWLAEVERAAAEKAISDLAERFPDNEDDAAWKPTAVRKWLRFRVLEMEVKKS